MILMFFLNIAFWRNIQRPKFFYNSSIYYSWISCFAMWKYFTTIKISCVTWVLDKFQKSFMTKFLQCAIFPREIMYWGKIMHNIFLFILDSFPFFDTDVIRFQESIGFVFFQRLCYQKLFSIIVHNKCFSTYFCSMGILQSDKEKISYH